MTQVPTQPTRTGWPAVLAAALLLGLLAMTWFGAQRMAHAEGAGTASHAETAAHLGVGHDHGAVTHAHDLEHHDEQDHSHALDLLLGFLMALLGVALLSVWARRPTRPMVVLRRVREQLVRTGRPPDPPCLNLLSIRIC